MKKIIILTITLFSVFSIQAFGDTHFIDFTKGSDDNDGSTKEKAWQHCPGDTNATDYAEDHVLTADDKFVFKGGVVYTGTITIQSSGDTNTHIIYDGNTAGDWGNGRAIIDNKNIPELNKGFYAPSPVSNITIQNFEFKDIGGFEIFPTGNDPVSNSPNGTGIDFRRGGNNLIIKNCYFHEIGEWHNQAPLTAEAISGCGVSLQNNSNVVISDCEFTQMSSAISIKTTNEFGSHEISDIEITGCDFHNYLRWCIDIAPRSNNAIIGNISIHDNKFHDFEEYTAANWQGIGGWPHTDGIFVRWNYLTNQPSPIRIFNNLFFSRETEGGGTTWIYLTEGPSASIYNNRFINTLHQCAIYMVNGPASGSSLQRVKINNNTFYGHSTALSLMCENPQKPDLGFISIKNNIFYDARSNSGHNFAIYIQDVGSDLDELDYNMYRSLNSGNSLILSNGNNGGELTLDELKAKGWETHGFHEDPLFADISAGLGEDSDKNDLNLDTNSPAKDNGIELPDFNTDCIGNIRPFGSAWDIGAYEYCGDDCVSADNDQGNVSTPNGGGGGCFIERLFN